VDRDGAFSSRRGTGEGLLPAPSELIRPRSIGATTLSPRTFQPNACAGGAYVPTSFVGMYAPCCSAPANGRIHRDKRRRDVCATQFSSRFVGRRPMRQT
jgi:hypothetical protein